MMGSADRSLLRPVNPVLLAVVVLLAAFGSVMVRSAVSGMDAGDAMFRRHLIGLAIGVVPLVVAWAIDYRKLQGWVGPIDGTDLLPDRVAPDSRAGRGGEGGSAVARDRWSPAVPAVGAGEARLHRCNSRGHRRLQGCIETPRQVLRVAGIASIPFALVVAVGDLGTGLVFIAITLGMLLVGGLRARWFLVFALVGAVAVGVVLKADLLQEYQVNRLMVFVDPTLDPSGAGYNLEQSKIAIGSGELAGKGLGESTQGNLNFLPERHTDFIFAVLGEELGFAGAVLLLGLYLALLITALEVSASARDLFGSLIAVGIIAMWTFQILENVGMTIGLMPITGIPLPFMSFGSSFMVTNMAAVGMLLSVWTRRT